MLAFAGSTSAGAAVSPSAQVGPAEEPVALEVFALPSHGPDIEILQDLVDLAECGEAVLWPQGLNVLVAKALLVAQARGE